MENLSKQRQAEIDKISNEAKTMYQSYQSETKLTAAQKKAKEDAIVSQGKTGFRVAPQVFWSRR
jgi:Skp family chaperone for outer membrane proteins